MVYYALIFCAQMSDYRRRLPEELRDETMLLIIDGHTSRISVLAAVIFILNNIDVLVFPPHSSHLLQMYDVGVAPALKTAFKNELEKRIEKLRHAQPGEKLQQMRIALVESFLDAVRRGATRGNIQTGFRMSGVAPYDPMTPLSSQFAVEPPRPGIYSTVDAGAEINEMVLTWPQGLDKLSQIEFKQPFNPRMEEVNYRLVWEGLLRKTGAEGRPLSPPPPPCIRLEEDPTLFREIHIPNLPA
jgi:hypothetical protein